MPGISSAEIGNVLYHERTAIPASPPADYWRHYVSGGSWFAVNSAGNTTLIGPSAAGLSAGISTHGNTSGTTGFVQSRILLVGGNNVTLSQSVNGQSATLTISAFNQTAQTQNRFNLTLSGNTDGVMAQISSGTMTLAGGNNITLSQAGNAVTIVGGAGAAAGSNTLGMSNLGNTSGTSGVVSGSALRYLFAGGNNVTLSQSIDGVSASLTISAFNQTAQTQNRFNLTLDGNTSGALAQVSSGTLTLAGGNNVTLSQAGNAITVSAFNQTVQTQNRFNLTLDGNTSGALAQISSGTMTLAGGNNITLSQNGNAVTVSASGPRTLNMWHNLNAPLSVSGTSNGTLIVFPLQLGNGNLFPGVMTANTFMLMLSGSSNQTSANSYTWRFGLYTMNGVSLSLANSVESTWGWSANANNSQANSGPRAFTIHSSQWSAQPVFSQGNYYGALIGYSGGQSLAASIIGVRYLATGVRSGTWGASIATGNTSMGWEPWVGVSNASRNATDGLPANIQLSELNKSVALVGFIPYIAMENISSDF